MHFWKTQSIANDKIKAVSGSLISHFGEGEIPVDHYLVNTKCWFICIALHCIALHYITLHYITLHYITLHYITLNLNLKLKLV